MMMAMMMMTNRTRKMLSRRGPACEVLFAAAAGVDKGWDFRRTTTRVHAVVSYPAADAANRQFLCIHHTRLISCSPVAHYRSHERIRVNPSDHLRRPPYRTAPRPLFFSRSTAGKIE